jgi:tetratricopeptide (TPR) repeat protein
MNELGRNDPCPCGSGKKFKKCCLAKNEAARPRRVTVGTPEHFITELRPELDDAVHRLLHRLESGEGRGVGNDVVALYQEHPRYHMTNFAMGVYRAMVERDARGAVPFFEKAVQILPPFPEAYFNLGNAARLSCDIPKAVAAYHMAERYSDGEDGIAELARKELRALEEILTRTSPFQNLDQYLANAELYAEAFQSLMDRQFEQAIDLFKRVLNENPDHVQSYGNMALAYAGLGNRSEAMACFERALELDPDYEPALDNRRVIAQMRDGEPFVPDITREVEFYADRFRDS